MREISQVVAPRLITQGNGPKLVKAPTTTKWNKVLPPATSATEPIVLRPYQIEAVQSVGNPSVGGGFSVFTGVRRCAGAYGCVRRNLMIGEE